MKSSCVRGTRGEAALANELNQIGEGAGEGEQLTAGGYLKRYDLLTSVASDNVDETRRRRRDATEQMLEGVAAE